MLTNQHAIHLIELGGVRMLIGTGPSGAPRVLAQLGEAEKVAESEPGPVLVPSWRPWLAMFGRVEVGSGR